VDYIDTNEKSPELQCHLNTDAKRIPILHSQHKCNCWKGCRLYASRMVASWYPLTSICHIKGSQQIQNRLELVLTQVMLVTHLLW